MRLEEILKSNNNREMWKTYCHFLDMDIEEYMQTQNSLLEEQINKWKKSKLCESILKDKIDFGIDDFRKIVPITDYCDYANILLKKKEEYLIDPVEIWIQTTWEGGTKPIKLAPYTSKMLEVFMDNIVCALLMTTSNKKYDVKIKDHEKILYGLAPLPFLTGIFPYLVERSSNISFLPPVEEAQTLSFKERNKLGFKLAMKDDVELFFGLGSVCYAVSSSFDKSLSKKRKKTEKNDMKLYMLLRMIKAKIIKKFFNRNILPKDLFRLKGFIVAGTDNEYYKDDLEKMWGIRPLEIFAGTEVSFIGTETYEKDGMYFFPNVGFYEFVRLEDSIRSHFEEVFKPKTYLMDEVEEGEMYELIISNFHGGAFMRYRVGDVYKCLGKHSTSKNEINIPRFKYVDRLPWIIDIAGFTRFNEQEITCVLKDCNIEYKEYVAIKDFNEDNKPFLHLFLEGVKDTYNIEEKIYNSFIKMDDDFIGLEKILGFNPLNVTVLMDERLSKYIESQNHFMRVNSMNPSLLELLKSK